jgi:predicted DNA-binding transcriptional regulator AlpA
MATRPALSDLGIAPRLLTREQAAAYCGVGPTTFGTWIRRGIIPGPIHRTHRWDREAIDAALNLSSGINARIDGNALDQWKASQRARRTGRNLPG